MNNLPFYPLEKNYSKIKELFGEEFLNKSIEDRLFKNEVLENNEILSKLVYGLDIYKLIKQKQLKELCNIHDDILLNKYNKNLENIINLDRLGVILIRPETVGNIQKYKEFLNKIKLNILLEKDITINFEKYWMLYHEGMLMGLKNNDPLIDFPTRTFNYINNKCHLFIVSNNIFDLSVSDYIFKYKGKHGNYTKNTLRGDITYNILKPYVIDGKTLTENSNIPLDPIGLYRLLVRNQLDSDGWHNKVDLPILFYAGQGVHIPSRSEINKDLNVLCDDDDIKLLSKIINMKG